MNYKLLTSIIIALLFSTCKKKEFPENISGEPNFYISGNINGIDTRLNAGVLNYYMYSDYKQDSSGVYTFIADLKPNNCGQPCPNSIRIELCDNIASTIGGPSNIANSIISGDYFFAQPSQTAPVITGYEVKYNSSFNNNALAYSWYFGDGNYSNLANPTHTFLTANNFKTCLEISDGSVPTEICNTIKVNATNVCRTNISTTNINGNTVSFTNQTSGTAPFSFKWLFGDGDSSTSPSPVHNYSTTGMYTARLRVIDATNDTAVYYHNVNTSQSYKSAPNYSVQSITPIYAISPALTKIIITYTDESGRTYTTKSQQQPNGSNFKIESIENFKTNERDQETKRLKIKFNCTVYNNSGQVKITNGEAVIAIGYK